MKITIILMTLAASLAGCQQQHGGTPSETDRRFLRDLNDHEQDSIAIAKLADQKASDAHVRTMAHNSVIRDEQQAAQIQTWLTGWYGDTFGAHTTDEGRQMLIALGTLSGSEFDKQYLIDMIDQYEHQVEASRQASAHADRPEIKEFAQNLIKDRTHLISHLHEHLDEFSGPKTPDHDHAAPTHDDHAAHDHP